MEVIIANDYGEMSKIAADMIRRLIMAKPAAVLGLATGGTPIGTYQELVRMHKEEHLSFEDVVTFNLDEYIGLPPIHDQSYYYFMNEHFFKHTNIRSENIHVPAGKDVDFKTYCLWYEEEIKKAGGIDLQLLGIGSDGHIAFNEPGSSLSSRTRIVTLFDQTRRDNARFFNSIDDVPYFAVTMGVGTILEARKILLLANSKKKARVVADFVEGPVTSMVTASALQLHQDCTVIVDEEAATELKYGKEYRWMYDNKHRIEDFTS